MIYEEERSGSLKTSSLKTSLTDSSGKTVLTRKAQMPVAYKKYSAHDIGKNSPKKVSFEDDHSDQISFVLS